MCVDGTHIKIIKPTENPHLFYNRKGFYSLNAMIICDHKKRIKYVNARHPGASHDSFICKTSEAANHFEMKYRNGDRNTRLLGHAGYPLQPWLLTPFRAPVGGTAQSRYNTYHSKARSTVERTFGLLKNRFRCLLGARELHYCPKKSVQIVNVCCALHNICIYYNIEDENLESVEEHTTNEMSTDDDESTSSAYTIEANRIRNEILSNF